MTKMMLVSGKVLLNTLLITCLFDPTWSITCKSCVKLANETRNKFRDSCDKLLREEGEIDDQAKRETICKAAENIPSCDDPTKISCNDLLDTKVKGSFAYILYVLDEITKIEENAQAREDVEMACAKVKSPEIETYGCFKKLEECVNGKKSTSQICTCDSDMCEPSAAPAQTLKLKGSLCWYPIFLLLVFQFA